MKKSFKKAVACLLAVLMVVFSVPFTAVAAPGDYNPDIDLQFGTLFDMGSGFTAGDNMYFGTHGTVVSGASANVDFSYASLHSAPVDLINGQLVLTKAKSDPFGAMVSEAMGEDLANCQLAEDYVLKTGDYFTITVVVHNVPNIASIKTQIAYSEAVEPAGIYEYKIKSGMKTTTYDKWGTLSDAEAAKSLTGYQASAGVTWPFGGINPLNTIAAPFSACNYYGEEVNRRDAANLDPSFADADKLTADVVESNEGNISQIALGEILTTDPTTGESDGGAYYDLTAGGNTVILETFCMKVVDDTKPIVFDIYDKENTQLSLDQGWYVAHGESTRRENLTTYAYNTYDGENAETTSDPEHYPERIGSRKMTFMGKRYEPGGSSATEYTVTFKDADGNTISAITGATGTAVTIPDLANYGKAADADAHYVAAWDSTPAATIGEADATYTVTYTSAAHTFGSATNEVAASCTEGGSYDEACTLCGWSHTVTTQATGHTLTAVPAAAATCTEAGNSAYWSCSACGKFFADANGENEIAENSWVIAASHQDVQHVEAVAATATTAGNIEYWYCAACGKYYSDANCETEITQAETVIPASGYTYAYDHMVFAENAGMVTAKAVYVAAEDSTKTVEYDAACSITSTTAGTCVEAATATWTATYEGNSDTYVQTLETYGDHQFGDWVVTTEPTNRDAGEETRTCALCGATETRPVAALGFTVTVEGSDLGTISGIVTSDNGATAVSEPLQVGTKYTVTATPNDGVEFVGWQMGNKIVSSNATYSSTIYADVMLIPVYVEAAAETMTVIFYDMYGNLIDTFTGTADDWAAYEYPEAPARPGMVFDKWDTEKEAVTGSCNVWAQYKANEEATKYTVTTSATVTLPEGIVNGEIPYNTKVTVSAEGATAWKIGESVVGYGAEYSFYIAADTAIEPVFEAVTEAPTVTVIGADAIPNTTRYNYAATMNVPAGYKIVDIGFVFGKNLAEADLDLDKVGQKGSNDDSGVVKVAHGDPNYGSDQFSMLYGISASAGRRLGTVKAFIVTSDGDIIYSDMFTQDYNA